jgi:hypothetical protein
MSVTLRYFDRTSLQEEAYLKLIKKYASKIKKNITITFDYRLACFGNYNYDEKTNSHIIKISIKKCCKHKGLPLEKNIQKYNLIATTIHELFHAQKQEELGQKKFWSDYYGKCQDIDDPDWSDFYSLCEVETRAYENKNVLPAVEYYDQYCK